MWTWCFSSLLLHYSANFLVSIYKYSQSSSFATKVRCGGLSLTTPKTSSSNQRESFVIKVVEFDSLVVIMIKICFQIFKVEIYKRWSALVMLSLAYVKSRVMLEPCVIISRKRSNVEKSCQVVWHGLEKSIDKTKMQGEWQMCCSLFTHCPS
jgi:hypothetical protein